MTFFLTFLIFLLDYTSKIFDNPQTRAVFETEIKPLHNTAEFAEKTYYKSRRCDAVVYVKNLKIESRSEKLKLKYLPQTLAKKVKAKASELYGEKGAGFINSLLLGDKSGISDEFSKDLILLRYKGTIELKKDKSGEDLK